MPITAISTDLQAVLSGAWTLLERGVRERGHAPVPIITVATIGRDGAPRMRSVVLRGASPAARNLTFYTDLRSRKVDEITRDPRLAAHVWDPAEQIQLRLTGSASVHAEDEFARAAWSALRPESRKAYGIVPEPGTDIAAPDCCEIPEDDGVRFKRFCVVVMTIDALETLHLRRGGHQRALFTFGNAPAGVWLAP